MKIYKCDICQKELKENETIERCCYDRFMDLCEKCNNIYSQAEKEIADKRKEIRIEYEKKMTDEAKKIFNKYKIDIMEE